MNDIAARTASDEVSENTLQTLAELKEEARYELLNEPIAQNLTRNDRLV